jgi:Family of unknown function (DUF5335)
MAVQKLDKAQWRVFCDRVSKALVGNRAEIEIASLALGSQVEAEWLPLLGIAYDPKDDIIEIALEGLDHMVHRPREMYVDLGPDGLTSLEVIDGDDVRRIVQFRDPLMLPPPSSGLQKDTSGEQGQR